MQLHISEKTGRGVPKITSLYGRTAFEFRQNSIVVKIPFNWINVMGDKVGDKVGNKVGDKEEMKMESVHLSDTHRKILSEMRNNPNIRKSDLERVIGVGKTTIDKGIAYLKKYGLIERVGSNKNGYWKVH